MKLIRKTPNELASLLDRVRGTAALTSLELDEKSFQVPTHRLMRENIETTIVSCESWLISHYTIRVPVTQYQSAWTGHGFFVGMSGAAADIEAGGNGVDTTPVPVPEVRFRALSTNATEVETQTYYNDLHRGRRSAGCAW